MRPLDRRDRARRGDSEATEVVATGTLLASCRNVAVHPGEGDGRPEDTTNRRWLRPARPWQSVSGVPRAQVTQQALARAGGQGHGSEDRVLFRPGGEHRRISDGHVGHAVHAAECIHHAQPRRGVHATGAPVVHGIAGRFDVINGNLGFPTGLLQHGDQLVARLIERAQRLLGIAQREQQRRSTARRRARAESSAMKSSAVGIMVPNKLKPS